MEPNERLAAVRDGMTVMYERAAQLIEVQDDLATMIPGFDWTVREMAVHLAGGIRRYAALINGEYDLSALVIDKEFLDARARSLNADNPETDPKALAEQIRDGLEHFMTVTASIPADTRVAYYAGLRPNVAEVAAALLGEPIIHGYDVASVVGAPWPMEPEWSALTVDTFQKVFFGLTFQPSHAVGLTATYRIDTAGTDPLTVRISDNSYEEVSATRSVDCTISADPVTAHLLITGRLSQWPAIALGRLTFSGERPEIGPRFFDLFMFP
jgi:uncharacterized protein (TIGR03083 family)